MNKWVGILLIVCGALAVVCLCTMLNREQELLKAAKINVQAAEKRLEAADVELDNELYRQQVYSILWKDVERSDDWKKEVEQLKQENGYYKDEN